MLTKEQREAIYRLALQQQYAELSDYLDSITVPEGWQVVPVEPTPAMVTAYSVAAGELTKRHLLSGSYPATWQPIEAGYTAMLAAAPKPGDSSAPEKSRSQRLRARSTDRRTPIDMILNCPACGLQHIDAPDERTPDWKNEPHRSHLCHGCGHIWRPADVPTNGVAAIKTKGKADSPIDPRPVAIESLAQRVPLSDEQIDEIRFSISASHHTEHARKLARAVEQAHGIRSEK